jgi:cob(I)alamin adenosyltransferase
MKIYTKTGDDGTTGLFGGTRVPKHQIRIESYGTIDELNSWLGLIRDQEIDVIYQQQLITIQEHLFTIGAILATDPEKKILDNGEQRLKINKVGTKEIQFLENAIDEMDSQLPQMTHFILPGGHTTVSYCHIARTVCRRAERISTLLHENEPFDIAVLSFINRLSDYLFVLARILTYKLQASEIKWVPGKKV